MTLGEIKIEALKLMFTNINDDIDEYNIAHYYDDENYKGYLYGMNGSINRCFGRLEERMVLPSKTQTLNTNDGKYPNSAFLRFNLDYLINDFYCIDRIVYEGKNGEYIADYDYMTEGNTLVLNPIKEGESYTVVYKPTIPRLKLSTSDDYDFSDKHNANGVFIPDSIASIIPYYIKGDLFRDDEPNEASESRNWFEQALNEISYKAMSKANTVKTIFSQTEV